MLKQRLYKAKVSLAESFSRVSVASVSFQCWQDVARRKVWAEGQGSVLTAKVQLSALQKPVPHAGKFFVSTT